MKREFTDNHALAVEAQDFRSIGRSTVQRYPHRWGMTGKNPSPGKERLRAIQRSPQRVRASFVPRLAHYAA